MALDGLYFNQRKLGGDLGSETRQGFPIYSGTAIGFEEWQFKLESKYNGLPDDETGNAKKRELGGKAVEGLSDCALRAAMDLGPKAISTADGIPKLIAAVDTVVHPLRKEEAKALWKEGSKSDGPLTRQYGESMVSFVARRRRWWDKLRALDKEFMVSEIIRADMLLECAKITEDQQLMIKTACPDGGFDGYAAKLKEHHGSIQDQEKRKSWNEPNTRSSPVPRGGQRFNQSSPATRGDNFQRKGYTRPPQWNQRKAFTAQAEATDDEQKSNPDEDTDEEVAYFCQSCGPESEFADMEDRIEQDIVCAYFCSGCDLDDKGVCEEISNTVHDEIFAFYSREEARSRGVPVAKHVHAYRPSSELTLDERKKKVALAKINSTCRACNQKGHWQGDKECPKGQKNKDQDRRSNNFKAKPKFGAGRTARIAVTDFSDDDGSVAFFSQDPITDQKTKELCMLSEMRVLAAVPPDACVANSRLKSRAVMLGNKMPEAPSTDPAPEKPDAQFLCVQAARIHRITAVIDDDPEELHALMMNELPPVDSCDDGDDAFVDVRRPAAGSHADPVPRFAYGKYKGELYTDVTGEHPDYYFWAKNLPPSKLSKYLSMYIDYVEQKFDIDTARQTLAERATGAVTTASGAYQGQPTVKATSKGRTSKLDEARKHWKDRAPCERCEPATISLMGSNAHMRVETCLVCGSVTKKKAEPPAPQSNPDECSHAVRDFRGSDKTTHRVFCLGCCTFVAEMPQSEYRAARTAQSTAHASGRTLGSDVSRHVEANLTATQATQAASTFKQLVRAHVSKHPEQSVTFRTMSTLLEDSVDISIDQRVAHMAVRSGRYNRGGQDAASSTGPPDRRSPSVSKIQVSVVAGLPRVDIWSDPRVFATLDEACNSTCHSEEWWNANKHKFDELGLKYSKLTGPSREYEGLGANRTLGRREVPFSLKLLAAGDLVTGGLKSNELTKGRTPLLLSLAAQATLGLQKDVRAGSCYLKDYDDYVQLYEVKGSGLRAICISEVVATVAAKEEATSGPIKRELEPKEECSNVTKLARENRVLAQTGADLMAEFAKEPIKQEEHEQRGVGETDVEFGGDSEHPDEDSDASSYAQAAEDSSKSYAERRNHLQSAPVEEPPEYRMIGSTGKHINYSNQFLNDLIEQKERSYTSYDEDGNRLHIKYFSKETSVKITQWNYDHFKTTWAWDINDEKWYVLERDVDIQTVTVFSKDVYIHLVIATQKPTLVAMIAMLPDMTANRGIMKSKQREYYMQNRQKIADADKHMWNIMKGIHFASQICRPRALGLGCGIFFFELFCGVAIFTVALFESAGYGGMDMGAAGENLLDPAWRKEVDDHIASRDPFCVFIGSPGRGPLSSLTADAKDLDKAAGWIAKLTSNLVAKGRIVILDEAFEELQTSDDDGPVTRLEGSLMDGFTGEPFEFMTGAYTYGSNSSEIKGVLDILDVNITGPSMNALRFDTFDRRGNTPKTCACL